MSYRKGLIEKVDKMIQSNCVNDTRMVLSPINKINVNK